MHNYKIIAKIFYFCDKPTKSIRKLSAAGYKNSRRISKVTKIYSLFS